MADDYVAKDATGTNVTFDSEDVGGGKQRPRVRVAAITSGASPDIGTTTDPAVTTDSDGSQISFLRGIVKLIAAIFPTSRGQKVKTGSLSVVLASDQDAVQLAAGANIIGGITDAGPHYAPVAIKVSSTDASGGVDLVAAAALQKIIIDDLVISVGTGCEIQIIEETSLTVVFAVFLSADAPLPLLGMKDGIRSEVANKKLTIKTSVASTLRAFGGAHYE